MFPLIVISQTQRNDLWKHGLKGHVQSCKTISYQYTLNKDGSKLMERGMLIYAGDGYLVDNYCCYNRQGYLVEEQTIPYEDEDGIKRVYVRNKNQQIICVYLYPLKERLHWIEKQIYEYDAAGKIIRVLKQDNQGREKAEVFEYDSLGNRIVRWKEDDISYYSLINHDDKCIEEVAVLPEGQELYHNYHLYNKQGKRVKTTFTADQKVLEMRENPESDNILDDGTVLVTDIYGNWVSIIFESNEERGCIVAREITYYP